MYRNLLVTLIVVLFSTLSFAHCDTLSGPVVQDARAALTTGDVTLVLKWVRSEDEQSVRQAFSRAIAVRKAGAEAGELADTWFFETVVRLHRAAEGAPYTGLKPAGAVDPEVAAADRALDSGNVDAVAAAAAQRVSEAIRRSFAEAHSARAHSRDNLAAGRRFVAAYIAYMHLVEHAAGFGASSGEEVAERE